MQYQIDQSGKIEQTNKATALCLSNDKWDAVLIKAKTKRQIQEIFRRNGQPRNFILFTFSAGLAILIGRNKHVLVVTIDREYYGREPVIKELILQILEGKTIPEIHFAMIGKKVKAHYRANLITQGKIKTKKVIQLKDLLEAIKKTEVGKRLKNA